MMQRPLSAHDLLAHGPLRRLGRQVHLLDETPSTNAFLRAHLGELSDGALAAAEFQTAGRGRQGRRWLAPRGSSVLLSALLFEPPDSPLITRAAMLASLAAVEAIDQDTDCAPAVRWPNDIVLGDRKLGGVLAESTSLPGRGSSGPNRAIIVGIGINCLQQRGHLSGELSEKATSIEIESQEPVDRAAVAGRLVARLDARLAECATAPAGWAGLVADWKARCGDVGAHVTLQHHTEVLAGTVVDISDDGDLIVQLDQGGRRRFGSATTTRIW